MLYPGPWTPNCSSLSLPLSWSLSSGQSGGVVEQQADDVFYGDGGEGDQGVDGGGNSDSDEVDNGGEF